jgi:hypothetical protein
MASKARAAFDQSCDDVDRLLEIHTHLGGAGPGRKHRLEVLNKSAIVLVTAFWEAYCEDLAAEALEHIVSKSADASKLPKELKKRIADELKADKNQLAVWHLADGGWRALAHARLLAMALKRNWDLNTPKSKQITELFEEAIGFDKATAKWCWKGKTEAQTRDALDNFVVLRGRIAHRGAASFTVTKAQVQDYFDLVKHLVAKTGGSVYVFVKKETGRPLW